MRTQHRVALGTLLGAMSLSMVLGMFLAGRLGPARAAGTGGTGGTAGTGTFAGAASPWRTPTHGPLAEHGLGDDDA